MAGYIMSTSAMKERFRMMDKDHDGQLSLDEINAFLREILKGKRDMSKEDARRYFNEVDKDRSGTIDFDEFVTFVHAVQLDSAQSGQLRSPSPASSTGAEPSRRARACSLPTLLRRSSVQSDGGKPAVPLTEPGQGACKGSCQYTVSKGNHFGSCHGGNHSGSKLAEDSSFFPKHDLRNDSTLDFAELQRLLCRGDATITQLEVRHLFDAMGKSQSLLSEIADFLHAAGPCEVQTATWWDRVKAAFDLSCSGPGSDLTFAHKNKPPAASIGRGKRLMDHGVNHFSPGPAAYNSDDKATCFSKQQPSVTFGNAARDAEDKHQSRTLLPGPASYDKDFSVMAHITRCPRATIGSAKRALQRTASLGPGPAAYEVKAVSKHVHGGNYFGVPGRLHPPCADEKRQFKKFDVNKNGSLSYEEVFSMMKRGDDSIQPCEVKRIFDACDKNSDGKIELGELLNYLHPDDSNENATSRRRLQNAFSAGSPGPLDYDTVKPRKQKVPGGSFGKAVR